MTVNRLSRAAGSPDEPLRLPTQPQGAPKRIIWLDDGKAYVATEAVDRTTSVSASTGTEYEHDTAVRSSRVIRRATNDEVLEWRARR